MSMFSGEVGCRTRSTDTRVQGVRTRVPALSEPQLKSASPKQLERHAYLGAREGVEVLRLELRSGQVHEAEGKREKKEVLTSGTPKS